jgi:uncharacterized cupredoxin-like copper-binding protein
MKLKIRSWLASMALASAMLLAACSSGGNTNNPGPATGSELNVTVTGELLKFDQATLTAKANSPVTVTLKNGSAAQKHNWVLVKDEATAADISTKAASNNGEPPADPAVLGKTSTTTPGGTANGNFTAPAAGTYVYLCTEPGHYAAGMRGTLTVN